MDDDDRRFFLHTLAQACERTGWRVHAWVLMGNHYHLFIETPEPNLSVGMKWLQNTFTRRFNVRHRKWGRVFGDRYKAVLVEGTSAHHYGALLDYIHLNPVRARMIRPKEGQSILDFPWSSVADGIAGLVGGEAAPSQRSQCQSGVAANGTGGIEEQVVPAGSAADVFEIRHAGRCVVKSSPCSG